MASSAVAVASVLLRTVLLCTVLAAVGLFGAASSNDAAIKSKHQYCIIGAGPAGLQMGYFMKKARRDYIILEKNTYPGSFFEKYPRHRKVISINKRFTGKENPEFNLRHDWNSLLSDDPGLLMRHYSKDFFPHADTLIQYMKDYASKYELNIQYETNIVHVDKPGEKQFILLDEKEQRYECEILVAATGIWIPNKPKMAAGEEYVTGYEDMSLNQTDYEGKTVLILGRGNSAYETADHIVGSTNLIHMVARSRVRLSWATHYVGDLRALNNNLLDTYQLKSLDAMLEASVTSLALKKVDGKLWILTEDSDEDSLHPSEVKQLEDATDMPDNFAMREPYDVVLRCLGFKFDKSIFGSRAPLEMGKGRLAKYPAVKPTYESFSTKNLYIAGTASHYRDFRKSSGAFIHGFRYTARALHRHLEWQHHKVKWPMQQILISDLLQHILTRLNEMSGPYQMFGILTDVILLDGDTVRYLEEVPIDCIPAFKKCTGHKAKEIIVINLEYGKNFSGPGKDVFSLTRATGEPSEADESNFLHPVFYYYKRPPKRMVKPTQLPLPDHLLHLVEDFLTSWDAPVSHMLPLRRFLEEVTGMDLRSFFAETCFKYALTYSDLPKFCEQQYMQGRSVLISTPEMVAPLLDRGIGSKVFQHSNQAPDIETVV
ncbi:FAD-dependent oxidoreductase domain-containing protein 2-like [Sycon ciliatum]|uniref:FAD-dependent oxidoreductase domain-containing protein 2-like n=1 Tax=Sycon ciliatum TaxID=27933 RepID=UPI0031F607F0